MKDFYFSNFEFSRNETEEIGMQKRIPNIRIGKSSTIDNQQLNLTIHLKVEVENSFSLELSAVGKFLSESKDLEVERFEKNAISIMFPYIRSQITLLTVQPNFIPIMLPPINVNALFDKLESESKSES